MMKIVLTAMALAMSPAIAHAQTVPKADTAKDSAPVDPARLAAARPVIDQVWPLGTYERLMRGTVEKIMDASLGNMYGMKASDFGDTSPDAKGDDEKTLGELASENDPAFRKRMKISMDVMMGEMVDLMSEIEPQVRDALAHAYARNFTVAQLNDLHRFFDTPTGKLYAHDQMAMMMGPDMMNVMKSFGPKVMKAMPDIIAKVKEATKDLPPPPGKDDNQ